MIPLSGGAGCQKSEVLSAPRREVMHDTGTRHIPLLLRSDFLPSPSCASYICTNRVVQLVFGDVIDINVYEANKCKSVYTCLYKPAGDGLLLPRHLCDRHGSAAARTNQRPVIVKVDHIRSKVG